MQLVDTHCHIQSVDGAGERATRELWAKATGLSGQQVVDNARAAAVNTMICVGCDYADSRLAIDFAAQHDGCYASIGLHPHEAALSVEQAVLEPFATLASQPGIVAIGECGLDYFYEHSPPEQQKQVLRFQLDLAVANNLPVIFHVREAFDDFWPIFDEYQGNIRGVLHSFTDSQANAEKALDRGLYIGINGIATFAKGDVQLATYKTLPLASILLETDAPFLTPTPFRGTINVPKHIATVAHFLAALRNEPVEHIAEITTSNARALFDL